MHEQSDTKNQSEREARHDDAAVLGIDNIALELPVAGLGSRVLAAILDYLLLYVLLFVLFWGFMMMAGFLGLGGWTAFSLGLLVYFVFNWGYFAGQEILSRGQTLGKRVVGLRVVGRSGGRPSVGSLLIRNLLREIDFFIGVPMIALDSLARRLGDRAGGTLVVHDRATERELTLRRVPPGWGARRIALVESFLRREAGLAADRRAVLADRIFDLLDREAPGFLGDEREGSDPVIVLRRAFDAREEIE